MNKYKKETLLYLLNQLNKCLFELEQELEEDIEINTERWKEYYIKINNIHSALWKLQDEIEIS